MDEKSTCLWGQESSNLPVGTGFRNSGTQVATSQLLIHLVRDVSGGGTEEGGVSIQGPLSSLVFGEDLLHSAARAQVREGGGKEKENKRREAHCGKGLIKSESRPILFFIYLPTIAGLKQRYTRGVSKYEGPELPEEGGPLVLAWSVQGVLEGPANCSSSWPIAGVTLFS